MSYDQSAGIAARQRLHEIKMGRLHDQGNDTTIYALAAMGSRNLDCQFCCLTT